jgi:hypothetical protein
VAERQAPGSLPLSVWPTAQQPAASQRRGRYLPGSTAHPAKMLPATARQAIAAYTQPGDLVLDPMCGIGTTLVEAAHLGRHALGIEYEARWAQLARANLTLATSQGAPGTGQVHLPGPGPTGAPRAGSRDPCPLTCPPIWRAGVVGASPTPSRSSHKYRHPVSRDSRAGGRRRPERAPPPGPGPGG